MRKRRRRRRQTTELRTSSSATYSVSWLLATAAVAAVIPRIINAPCRNSHSCRWHCRSVFGVASRRARWLPLAPSISCRHNSYLPGRSGSAEISSISSAVIRNVTHSNTRTASVVRRGILSVPKCRLLDYPRNMNMQVNKTCCAWSRDFAIHFSNVLIE